MTKARNKAKRNLEKNPLEQLIGGGLDQILGTRDTQEKQGNNQETVLFERQEVILGKHQNEKSEERKNIEVDIDYAREVLHVGEIAAKRETREIENQLKELMAEIKKLADSSKEMQMQFREVAVEQYVAKPGKYHKNFFSWLLSVIKAARMKVEDSNAWLTAMHCKKRSKEYGAMAKKYGTTFTLNNERTVATQVG